MNIIIKKGKEKVDHPSKRPYYKRAMQHAQKTHDEGGLKFESPGAEKDYWRRVNANPMNIPYAPEFYPPLETKVYYQSNVAGFEETLTNDFYSGITGEIYLYCEDCTPQSQYVGTKASLVTKHIIGYRQCLCTRCKKDKPFRIKYLVTTEADQQPEHSLTQG
jgi:hypothetical protein